jgi:transposase
MQAVLKAQINKTDRNDARGIAQMIRVGLYRPVHIKTLRSQKLRMLLTHRNRNFGLKFGMVGKVRFEARILELVENIPDLAVLVEPLLIVRRALRERIVILHRRLLAMVRDDEYAGDDDPGRRPRGGADLSRHHRGAAAWPVAAQAQKSFADATN